jgi:hypothetical protein
MDATDAVKDNVYALTREVVNFFHEVELPVIRDSFSPLRSDLQDVVLLGSTPFQKRIT